MSNYPDDEYYDDEDDYEDDDDEPSETSFDSFLCKSKRGHLYVEEVYGWKYRGQDWGMTVGQWETTRIRIRELAEELQPVAIRIGRDLKAGESVACYLWYELDEEQPDQEPTIDDPVEWIKYFETGETNNDIPF